MQRKQIGFVSWICHRWHTGVTKVRQEDILELYLVLSSPMDVLFPNIIFPYLLIPVESKMISSMFHLLTNLSYNGLISNSNHLHKKVHESTDR
jgi:hypothetical protein